jgi:hypothetical protein
MICGGEETEDNMPVTSVIGMIVSFMIKINGTSFAHGHSLIFRCL